MSRWPDRARAARTGPLPSEAELKALVEELKAAYAYGDAREVLERAVAERPADRWAAQQLALCTYKDEELDVRRRLARALELLDGVGLRDPALDEPEVLALGGAVYKRLWEQGGQMEHLYEALLFYRAAWTRAPDRDLGYGGINAAHLLDLLAARARSAARRAGTPEAEADALATEAARLRGEIRDRLCEAARENEALRSQYWYAATLAEAFFGLGEYEAAGDQLAVAARASPSDWQVQTTFRQLASLARLQGVTLPDADPSPRERARAALARLIGDEARAALSSLPGKVGLALSGGGFRASFYHLGVLARLAEMDVLPSVEVLSTVSGGSIVGAHYYLELRRRLQEKPDAALTREEYIDLVGTVARQFLDGVQRNLRTRVLGSLWANLKMLLPLGYSRTHRLGELYEAELYRQVADGHLPGRPRTMPELLIHPPAPDGRPRPRFHPRYDNWRRRAKVPVLLLNTTSLNSGHSWHFTASWMGEPPGLMGAEVDKNARYRRLYYRQAPTRELRTFRLGYAVAASSCVPALFDPMPVDGLYPGSTVRLVDGGVHDNQGAGGLLDEGCTVLLCSDASGQMGDLPQPRDGMLSVLTRSGAIQGDRVREAEYQDLKGRVEGGSVQGLFFVHLKKDLEVHPLDWIRCQDPSPARPQAEQTPYGVAPDLQRAIAGIRTDLDSFTEVEAYALMASGYLMAEQECRRLRDEEVRRRALPLWAEFQVDAPRGEWPFLPLIPLLGVPASRRDPRRDALAEQLAAASQRAFKVWRLVPALRRAACGLLGAGAVALALLLWLLWGYRVEFSVGTVALAVLAVAAGSVLPLWKVISPEKAKRSLLMKVGVSTLGYLGAKLHLLLFDRWFLRQGTLARLLGERGP
ncbi:MAG: hypothetical protein Kow0092_39590 [Deferrisomatales bacterium]